MESNARYFRRRAAEEFAAAQRSVTPAARDRRIEMAKRFLSHLDEGEANETLFEWGIIKVKPKGVPAYRREFDLTN